MELIIFIEEFLGGEAGRIPFDNGIISQVNMKYG
jgi:hypothetical protein